MSAAQQNETRYTRLVARLGFGILLIFCLALVLLWRIDNPRAERIRIAVLDRFVPSMEWAMAPVNRATQMLLDFRSYERLYEQNRELRQEIQRMKAWREAAIQLEQENARLLDLNKVKLSPKLSSVSGRILSDSGSRFRQTALINLGRQDGLKEGWATMDGLGLVGRIVAVGERSSRLIFVTDSTSQIPVKIMPSNRRAILSGNNTLRPQINFIENAEEIKPGDRIETSGDGGVFPPDLLVGQVAIAAAGEYQAILAADFERLALIRVIRFSPQAPIQDPDRLIGPLLTDTTPEPLAEIGDG